MSLPKLIAVTVAFSAICLTFVPVGLAQQPDAAVEAWKLYVSTDGKDTNAGTEAAPFATIPRAQTAVREKLASGFEGDIHVSLSAGIFRITQPLTFGPEDTPRSGRKNAKQTVVYRGTSEARSETVISGGVEITGWTKTDEGLWSAKLPAQDQPWQFRELFVDGKRQTRARHPNEGYLRVAAAGEDKRTNFTFNAGDVPATATGAELVFLHDWSTTRVNVAEVDVESNKLVAENPIGAAAPHYRIDHFEPHPRYFLENKKEFLDQPGEWYLDAKAGQVFFKPAPDDELSSFKATVPVASQLLVVQGTEANPVCNLHFVSLHLQHCDWQLPKRGYAAGQAGFHERRDGTRGDELRDSMPTAVLMEYAEACAFSLGSVKHVGGAGLQFGKGCKRCDLTDCEIADVAGNGVLIGDSNRSEKFAATENKVVNNRIHDCGVEFSGSVGLWVGMANHTYVGSNSLYHLPYTGVSVGWQWNPSPTPCHHNVIEHNRISQIMQVLSDGGGIYTLGRQPGTVLRSNRIYDVSINAGRAESNGMFLDEGTTEIVIEKNVIYNIARSPLRFHQAGENLVRNNVLVVGEGVPMVRYNSTPEKNIKLENNEAWPANEFDELTADQLIEAGWKAKD